MERSNPPGLPTDSTPVVVSTGTLPELSFRALETWKEALSRPSTRLTVQVI